MIGFVCWFVCNFVNVFQGVSKETGDEAIGSDELILVCEEEELGESQEEVRLLNANVCLSMCLYVC